jgi:hypothetical protein
MILDMCDPTEFYLIYKQANEGGERDIEILDYWMVSKRN